MRNNNKQAPNIWEAIIISVIYMISSIIFALSGLLVQILAENRAEFIIYRLLYIMAVILVIAMILMILSLVSKSKSIVKAYQHRIKALLIGEITGILGIIAGVRSIQHMYSVPLVVKVIYLIIMLIAVLVLSYRMRNNMVQLSEVIIKINREN